MNYSSLVILDRHTRKTYFVNRTMNLSNARTGNVFLIDVLRQLYNPGLSSKLSAKLKKLLVDNEEGVKMLSKDADATAYLLGNGPKIPHPAWS